MIRYATQKNNTLNQKGMKQILIINDHPDKESFNYALSEAYRSGASTTNANIDRINITDLVFEPNLKYGFRQRMDLEPDLIDGLNKIKRADHIVWVFPIWWYGYPAMMKGFIDRTFLPGIVFENEEGKVFPKKLLKGKTARLIVTADTPLWYNNLIMKKPAVHQMKKGTLQFCGINPVNVTYMAIVKSSSEATRAKWLKKNMRWVLH